MFDVVAMQLTDPKRFASGAERRLKAIAEVLGLRKDRLSRRYPLSCTIPYFVHDPKVLSYGNVEFGGIDVPAAGYDRAFYQHEEAHGVLIRSFGVPPAFFNEGFACFASNPNSNDDHRCSLVGLRNKCIPRLADIAGSSGFWKNYKAHKPFMYRAGGSFVAWTFGEFGAGRFASFVSRCTYDASRTKVLAEFNRAYRVSLFAAERRWKAWLLSHVSELEMSARRRIGNITETEWERTRVQMVCDALDPK
jgi:hypothetical protein